MRPDEETPQYALRDNAGHVPPQGGRNGCRGKGEAGSSATANPYIAGDCCIWERDDEPFSAQPLRGARRVRFVYVGIGAFSCACDGACVR